MRRACRATPRRRRRDSCRARCARNVSKCRRSTLSASAPIVPSGSIGVRPKRSGCGDRRSTASRPASYLLSSAGRSAHAISQTLDERHERVDRGRRHLDLDAAKPCRSRPVARLDPRLVERDLTRSDASGRDGKGVPVRPHLEERAAASCGRRRRERALRPARRTAAAPRRRPPRGAARPRAGRADPATSLEPDPSALSVASPCRRRFTRRIRSA